MKTSNVDLTKSDKSNFGEFHSGVLDKLKGSRFEDIARLNPYMSYDFKSTPWDDIGDALGFGTEEDEIRREYDKSAREYDAQLLQLLSEDRFNSPAEQSSRLGAAGFNPALSGLSDVENAGEFAQEQTSPSYVRSRSSMQDFGNVMMNALNVVGTLVGQYNGIRSNLADLNIKDAQAAGLDLDNNIKINSLSDAFLRQLYGFGAVRPGDVEIDDEGNVTAIFPSEEIGDSQFVPYGKIPVPKRYRKVVRELFNNRKYSLKVLGDTYGEAADFRKNAEELSKHLPEGQKMYPGRELNDLDRTVNIVFRGLSGKYAELLKKQLDNDKSYQDYREGYGLPQSQAYAESQQNSASAAESSYRSDYYSNISGADDAELHNKQTSSETSRLGISDELNGIYKGIIDDLAKDVRETGSVTSLFYLIGLGSILQTGSVTPKFDSDFLPGLFKLFK